MSKLLNLTGKKFDKWFVIKRVPNRGRNVYWLCKCVCGVEREVDGVNLKERRSKSCGCYRPELISNSNKENSKIEHGLATKRTVFRLYVAGAKRRNLSFDLTFEQFIDLSQKSCYYCGIEPSTIRKSDHDNGDFIYTGLDRKNSKLGYTLDNVVPCCFKCNRMKSDNSIEEFLSHIKKILLKQEGDSHGKSERSFRTIGEERAIWN